MEDNMPGTVGRRDLMTIFNAARFTLIHYARGYFPVHRTELVHMPVNRLFFPLENPGGEANFIEDTFRRYPLIPGNLYFIPAYLPARFALDGQLLFLSVQCRLELFPGVELFSDCPRMLELPAPPEGLEMLRLFDSEKTDACRAAVRAGSLAYSMLTGLLDRYAPEDFWKPLSLRKYDLLTDYLKENGNARTSVAELAAVRHESREGFTRHFTEYTGITPKQLIDRFVMSRCLTLIVSGYSFKEIAEKLQFRDEFAFSRYFKRNAGVSPRKWRDQRAVGGVVPRP